MTTENPIPPRQRDPWSKGRLIGQKRPLKPKDGPPPGSAADEILVDHQPEDRQRTRPHRAPSMLDLADNVIE